jgi:predicted HD superfamily hydrolase involved in NAD metabolism
MALLLARHWGLDLEAALTAALCHDLAKPFPPSVQRERLEAVTVVPVSEEDRACASIWHGIVAAQEAHDAFGVRDRDVLEAIAWHSTGPESLASIGLAIYVADYIEPSRNWPGVEDFRRRVFDMSLTEAALAVAQAKVDRLNKKGTRDPLAHAPPD